MGSEPATQSIIATLACWAAATRLEDIPSAALTAAKRSILDTIGVTFAASTEPIAGVLAEYLGSAGDGACSVVGRPDGVAPETAALVNGALAHALDYDDVTHWLGGHPSIPVLWPALASAESRGARGADLLLAYCAALEVQCAIGRGVNFHHYDHGWHPTATLGGFGAATAAALAGGLGVEGIAVALAYATTTASGIKASFGTMAKPIQVGRAAQSGVLNAALARAGATANLGALEAKQGFANVYDGAGNVDLSQTPAHLGAPWNLIDPGIWIKLHPCCGGTHSAVDAAIALRGELPSGTADIVAVDAFIHKRRFAHLDRPTPKGPLDAKFSLQHTVALALLNGRIRMDDFRAEVIDQAELAALRARVTGHPLPPDREGPEHFAAEVHVRLKDGSVLVRRLERAAGRTPETAFSDEQIYGKFRDCSARHLSPDEQDRLIELIDTLEQQEDLTELTRLLRMPQRNGGSEEHEGGDPEHQRDAERLAIP